MSGIVIACPTNQMFTLAEEIAREADIDARVLLAHSQDVVARVTQLAQEGASVVVARGNHAHLLKTLTDLPVVEIVLSGQELATLIDHAMRIAPPDAPIVALVGFRYMFSDPEPLSRILRADTRVYYASEAAGLEAAVQRAAADGARVIVGGEIACRAAETVGLPSLFMDAGRESIRTAIRTAKRVLYGIEQERKKTAEFMSLLDYSFDAILRLDAEGRVTLVNYMAEKAFRRPARELQGLDIRALLDIARDGPLERAMSEKQSLFSTVVRAGSDAFVANIASVRVGGDHDGFILSLQEFKRIDDLEERVRLTRTVSGYTARARFSQMPTLSQRMRQTLDDARQYAQYDLPILIDGAFGTPKRALAECVHNAGLRRKNPFVALDLSVLAPGMHLSRLLGAPAHDEKLPARDDKGAFRLAHTGTLLIESIERLEMSAQYQLLSVISDGTMLREDGGTLLPVDVRVICTTHGDLPAAVQQGLFLEPLFSRLSQLTLMMPALCEHAEDIPRMLDDLLDLYAQKYRKYVALDPDARALIYAHPWPANDTQLSQFCEKLILLAREKTADAAFVRRCLPAIERAAPEPPPPILVSSPEEADLRRALQSCNGSRQRAAALLGVSKATLWRRMKRYGVG